VVADDEADTETADAADAPQADAGQVFDNFVPTADVNDIPALIVAAEDFPFSVVGEDSFVAAGPLANEATVRIVDDFSGGLVVERTDGTVAHYQSSGDIVELSTDAPLLDVGYWDGSPRAFVLTEPNQVDWIRLAAEDASAPRERQTHIQLDPGDEIISFSAGGFLQAIVVDDGACGRLQFFDPTGERTDLTGPTPPDCTFRGRPVFASVALSPLSDAVAVAAVTYRADGTEGATDLLVNQLAGTAEPFSSRRIGEGLDQITSLSYDGTRVAYIRTSGQDDADAASAEDVTVAVLNLAQPSSELSANLLGQPTVSSVAFARIGVDAFS
jgi:hypothetical protein